MRSISESNAYEVNGEEGDIGVSEAVVRRPQAVRANPLPERFWEYASHAVFCHWQKIRETKHFIWQSTYVEHNPW